MSSNLIVRTGAAKATQAGQSATEFLIALLVMLPLFLAVAYAGRYGEIHQTATQASRYAAFQRVMQPDSKVLSDAKIEDQMRARYFTSWKLTATCRPTTPPPSWRMAKASPGCGKA